MKYPLDARLVLTDGPVSIFIHDDKPEVILAAYERLGKLVKVATGQLQIEAIKNPRPVIPNLINESLLAIHAGVNGTNSKDLS